MRAAGGGSQYESWGSLFFRPFVDTVVVALDKATGGLYTQIKQLSKQNLDPMALLQAMVDAQEQAAYVLSNPAVFLQNVMYYFMEEAWRRFSQWVQDLVSASATHTATLLTTPLDPLSEHPEEGRTPHCLKSTQATHHSHSKQQVALFRAIMLGLVPIATLPALLWGPSHPLGQAANVVSLKMYQVPGAPHGVV